MNLLWILFFIPGTQFRGTIIDAVRGEGIPYVQVTLLPEDTTVITDTNGYFEFEGNELPGKVTVKANRIGYRPGIWTELPTSVPVKLTLTPVAIPIAGVTSTATRLKSPPVFAAPVNTILMEKEQPGIVTDPGGVINHSAGVMVNNYTNLSTLSLRGAGPEQTLVLWDRIPLNSSLNSLADLTLLPPPQVEKIELARGGASALYGATPLGGVVNIITPEPTRRQLDFGTGLGSFGTRDAALTVSLPGTISWLAAGSYYHTDNSFTYPDSLGNQKLQKNAGITRTALMGKSQAAIGLNQSLNLAVNFGFCRRGSPGPVSFPTDSARLEDQRLLIIAGYDLWESPMGRLTARLHHHRHHEQYLNPSPYFTAADTHQLEKTSTNITHQVNLNFGLLTAELAEGVEAGYEAVQSTTVKTPSRLNAAGYLEAGMKTGWIGLTPAIRYEILTNRRFSSGEVVSTYGALSPRLTLTLSPNPVFSFYLGVNRSFRAPSFNELFWPQSEWAKGNPKLKPEWATGMDAAIGMKLSKSTHIRITAFYSQVQDLIQWIADSSFVYQPVNLGLVRIKGLELEPQLKSSRAGINGSLTLQECRTESTFVPYRPLLFGRTTLWLIPYQTVNSTLGLQLTASGTGMKFTNQENTDTLPGYLNLDAGISLEFKLTFVQVTLSTGIQNLLDQHYQSLPGYPLPGRGFYLKTRVRSVK